MSDQAAPTTATKYDIDQDTPPEPMPQPESEAPIPATPQEPTAPVQPAAVADVEGSIDVDPSEALFEAKENPDAANSTPQEQPEVDDVVDILVPKVEPKEWKIGPDDMPLVYIQRPLSFIQKMQWFSLVGDVLDKSMSGEDGISVNEILTAPGDPRTGLSMDDFRDADTFVRAVGKLIVHAPEFLLDSYCVWLAVPTHQRGLVKEVMAMHESEGGLSDDQGLEIIEVFIDQNFDALADFFGGKIATLQRRVAQRQEARKNKKEARARA